jgi:signal transduction histidine kinase
MTYKQIKWLILWLPTATIGLWEYLRHTVLLPYVSMELGNVLAPVIVLLVTVTLMRRLFAMLEDTHEALQRERLLKAALEEREQLARELHDGISQSLFLLSVKLDKLDGAKDGEDRRETSEQIRQTVRHVYEDVRQSIANLRSAPVLTDISWIQSVKSLIEEMYDSGGPRIDLEWRLSDASLTRKEKVELFAIFREALINVQKHAHASSVRVRAEELGGGSGFRCTVEDDGVGTDEAALTARGRFGVRMMRSRAESMGWKLSVRAAETSRGHTRGTVIEVGKEGDGLR